MKTITKQVKRPEGELTAQIAGGDRAALEALFDRYFRDVFDLAARTLRNSEAAASVTETAFVQAWDRLRAGASVSDPKAWLLAGTRSAALAELRRIKRVHPSGELEPDGKLRFSAVRAPRNAPESPLRDKKLVELVWASAATLPRKDYSLLDLHLRRGLAADNPALSFGRRNGTAGKRLARIEDSLGETVALNLLVMRGRDNCSQLDALLSAPPATHPVPDTRRKVQEHLGKCATCQESKKKHAPPGAILAALSPVSVDAEARDAIWRGIAERIDALESNHRWASMVRRRWIRVPRPFRAAVIAGLVLLLLVPLTALAITSTREDATPPPPKDPEDVRSLTHAPGVTSSNSVIEIVWTSQPDTEGYSVQWDAQPEGVPDDIADLPGSATSATSPELSDGTWYFHLRTQGAQGSWTSTVHLGPFFLEQAPSIVEEPEAPGAGQRPRISISDATVREGDGTTEARIEVSLSGSADRPVRVDYRTVDDTATAPLDYSTKKETLKLRPGDPSKVITVAIIGDSTDEGAEGFFVRLARPRGAALSAGRARVRIIDDDKPPRTPSAPRTPPIPPAISINDVTVNEGDLGVRRAEFTISLSRTSGRRITFDFATHNGTARGGLDYRRKSGSLGFRPGDTTKELQVKIFGDTREEENETFFIDLSSATNATIADARALTTIGDDDEPPPRPMPAIAISDVVVTEGNGRRSLAIFSVSLSRRSDVRVGVDFLTSEGRATTPEDYEAKSGSVSFRPGDRREEIRVRITSDEASERAQAFFVDLLNPRRAVIAHGRGRATILDDD